SSAIDRHASGVLARAPLRVRAELAHYLVTARRLPLALLRPHLPALFAATDDPVVDRMIDLARALARLDQRPLLAHLLPSAADDDLRDAIEPLVGTAPSDPYWQDARDSTS